VRTDILTDRLHGAEVAFHSFANMPNDENCDTVIAYSERDDTQMSKEGGTKGKQGNVVGNPAIGKGEAGHSSPYTTTFPSSS
jgi:hypothetical protein